MSRIELRIDRLVLDGLDLAPGDAQRLSASIERELAALIAIDGVPSRESSNDWRVRTPALTLQGQGDMQGWGRQIAQSIYGSLPGASAESAGGRAQ